MTVAELRKLLEAMPDEAPVVVHDSSEGNSLLFHDVSLAALVDLRRVGFDYYTGQSDLNVDEQVRVLVLSDREKGILC